MPLDPNSKDKTPPPGDPPQTNNNLRNAWTRPPTISKQQSNSAKDSEPEHTPQPIWKRGFSEYSVFFNLSKMQHLIKEASFYSAVRETLPFDHFLGLRHLKGPNQGLLIEYSLSSEEDCKQLINHSVQVDDQLLKPFRSLPPDANIVQLHLSNLPFFGSADYSSELEKILVQYGKVLNVSLKVEKHSGIFIGSGTAVISIPSSPGMYSELTHEISFFDHGVFRATWRNIPAFCRYCHKPDHSCKDCRAHPNNTCHTCNQVGHNSNQCEHNRRSIGRKRPKIVAKSTDTRKIPQTNTNLSVAPQEQPAKETSSLVQSDIQSAHDNTTSSTDSTPSIIIEDTDSTVVSTQLAK